MEKKDSKKTPRKSSSPVKKPEPTIVFSEGGYRKQKGNLLKNLFNWEKRS